MQWSVARAAKEWGVDPKSLGRWLVLAEIEAKKTYHTQEINRAVFGDIDQERLRHIRESADKLALQNAQARGQLVRVADVAAVLGRVITAIKGRILAAANLEREDKEKILNECGELWDAFAATRANPERVEPTATADGEPVGVHESVSLV